MFLLNSHFSHYILHLTGRTRLCVKRNPGFIKRVTPRYVPKSSMHEYSCYAIPLNRQNKLFRQTAWLIDGPTDTCRQSLSDWYTTSKDRKVHGIKFRLLLNVLKKIHNATLFIPQPCPKESENFRDVQCASYNGRDIFINGERAKWKSYSRGNCHKCNNRSTF